MKGVELYGRVRNAVQIEGLSERSLRGISQEYVTKAVISSGPSRKVSYTYLTSRCDLQAYRLPTLSLAPLAMIPITEVFAARFRAGFSPRLFSVVRNGFQFTKASA